MKKLLFISCIVIILLQSFIIIEKQTIKKQKILEALETLEKYETFSYTTLKVDSTPQNINCVNEPPEMYKADIIERIKMLNEHLESKPTVAWVRDVLKHAENEIMLYRHNSR